jgi:hypothetical protein
MVLGVLEVRRFRYSMNFGGAVAANIAANVTTSEMYLPSMRDVGNMIYRSVFIGGGTYLVSELMKTVLKWKPADLSKFKAKDFAQFIIALTVSIGAHSQLVANNIIPNTIIPAAAASSASSGARSGS